MKDYYGPNEQLAEAMMDNSDWPYLILEAKTNEYCFNKFRIEKSSVIFGSDKDFVLKAGKRLTEKNKKNYLGIVDNDFDRILNPRTFRPPFIFDTDTHDQETMIFNSGAFDCFLRVYAHDKKLKKFEERRKKRLIEVLLCESFKLACVPLIGHQLTGSPTDGINVQFLKTDVLYNLIDDDLIIDVDKLVSLVNDYNSDRFRISTDHLIQKFDELNGSENFNPWVYCNGHHMARILTYGLDHIFGKNTPKLEFLNVETSLSLLYSDVHFKSTNLFAEINKWQLINKKRVLTIV